MTTLTVVTPEYLASLSEEIGGEKPPTPPTQPPDGGNMETRVTKLETRLDTILPTLATKGDVSEAKSSIVMWIAGIGFAITAIIISVLAFMLNRAVPVQASTQAAPIIIYPQQTTPPASRSPQASKRGQ